MAIFKHRPFYGWVIVAAFLVISTVIFGELTSFGVFFKSIEAEFGLNRTMTSAIFSLQNLFGAVMSFIGGWAVDRYGPRRTVLFIGVLAGLSFSLTSQTTLYWQLFLTYSLLFSVIGVVYTVIMSTVSRWFDKNLGIALGIAGSGIGLGAVIIVPLATYLIEAYNWRIAYIIMGLITWLLIIPLSQLLKDKQPTIKANKKLAQSKTVEMNIGQQRERNDKSSAEFSLRNAFRTRSFWLVSAIWLFNAFCYFVVIIHIIPYITDADIPVMEAAIVVSIIGASYIAGRLLMGKISDAFGRKRTSIVCALIAGIAMTWLLFTKNLLMLYAFGLLFGFANGGLDPCMAALVSETFGMRKIGIIMGALQVNWGIGVVAGPAIAGLIFDLNNSYFLAFLVGALTMFAIALLTTFIRKEQIIN